MELLIAILGYAVYFILNTLSWMWVGCSLGCGALVAYEMFGGNLKIAGKALKDKVAAPAA